MSAAPHMQSQRPGGAMAGGQSSVQNYLGKLDSELNKYPTLTRLESQTSVPKTYAVIGLVSLYFFMIVFNLGGQLLTNLAGFIIPGYYSLEALFSQSSTDDTQWLTYWVVFAFFNVIEAMINVVYWFPFYYTFKFVFLLWLSLPMFRGADTIFQSFMRPMFGQYFGQQRPMPGGVPVTKMH